MEKLTLIASYQKILLVFAFVIANNVKIPDYFLHIERSLQFSNPLCSNWTGNINTDWNNVGNWCGGSIPSSVDNVIIPTGVSNYPVISAGVNASVNSITINSSASLTLTGSGNLTLSNNGVFTNNGTFTAAGSTGAIIFSGNGYISGIVSFNNVTINGAIDFDKTSTINGILLLNAGGTASGPGTHTVNYSASSTLIYNETVVTGNEWAAGASGTTAAGAGIPQNVMIQSGTVSIISGGTNRAIAGNLDINSGAKLQITGSQDLFILGNWSNSGSFVANGKKVTFKASGGTQVVSGNTTFFDLTLDNTGATTDFGSGIITINDEFRISHGTMNGNTSTFIFNGSTSTLEGVGAKNFYNLQVNAGANLSDLTASAGNTIIGNSYVNNGSFTQHNTHITRFNKSGAIEALNGTGTSIFGNVTVGGANLSFPTVLNANTHSFTITGGSLNFTVGSIFNGNTNTVTFSNKDAVISGTGTANFYNLTTNVAIDPASTTNISNNLLLNDGGSVINHSPAYSVTSTLIYNTATPNFINGYEWTGNTNSAGIGEPQNIFIQNTNSIALGGNRTLPGNLNIASGDALNINGNTLTLNGIVSGTGTLSGSTLSGLIIGGNAGTLYFNQTTNNVTNVLKNLTINSGTSVILGNALNITGGNAGVYGTVISNGTLSANGNLTLKSNVNGTAEIGNSTGMITGDVTVERYIPAKRAWRFLSVPFKPGSGSQTINGAWQEGSTQVADPGCPASDPAPAGYGTQITYDGLNGYDWNTTLNPSIKVWENNAWITPNSTNGHLITEYPAYCLFVRGDRHLCTNQGVNAGSGNTVLRAKGFLNETGSDFAKNYTSVNTGDYLFIGNPYASSIDIVKALSHFSGINQTKFWVWDPSVGGLHGVGAFITYDNGLIVPAGSSYGGGTNAQSGQAFFVQANTSGTITTNFKQADKTTAEGNVFSKLKPTAYPAVYINLLAPSGDSLMLKDGVGAGFDNNFSADIDENDAQKQWNFDENIALVRNEYRLAIEMRAIPDFADTLFLKLFLRQQPYALQIFSNNLSEKIQAQAWLVDKYLNTKITLNVYDTTLYNFVPNSDTNSYRNRFMLVFKRMFIATPVSVIKVINQANPGITGNANSITTQKNAVSVSPNPAIAGEKIKLQFSNMNKGCYHATLTNTLAKVLAERTIEHNGGSYTYSLQTSGDWAAGNYFIKITGENNYLLITKLLISK